MPFSLHTVTMEDADILIRNCDYPANQNDPLHRTMFPQSSTQYIKEEEIMWRIEGLRTTLKEKHEYFRKICLQDGTPIGFAGWSLEQITPEEAVVREMVPKTERDAPGRENPKSLDVESWMEVSDKLKAEKTRVLSNRSNIWRLMILSVTPEYQRQGVGSMLLEWGCEEADRFGRDAFVMASPAAVSLYLEFGFKVMGEVRTELGVFRSMLREARGDGVGNQDAAMLLAYPPNASNGSAVGNNGSARREIDDIDELIRMVEEGIRPPERGGQ